MRIGIFDSGLGGLAIAKAITDRLPQYNYLYLGDTKRVPYGNRSLETVHEFTAQALDYLFANDCRLVIIACNTASAEALRKSQQEYLPARYPNRRILGVLIPAAEAAVEWAGDGPHGVLATAGTVASGSYERELRRLAPGSQILQKAAPLLVPLVENDALSFAEPILQSYLAPLIKAGAKSVILGCTHYCLLKEDIRRLTDLPVISQDEVVPDKLAQYLDRHPEIETDLGREGERLYQVTDLSQGYQAFARKLVGESFDLEVCDLGQVRHSLLVEKPALSEVQVDAQALLHNVNALRSLCAPDQKISAVVKANAYGHGLREVAHTLEGNIDYFQIDDIEELRQLRQWTDARALLFGYVQPSDLFEAVALGCELALYDVERLRVLGSFAREVTVHLKIDALLGRLGLMPESLEGFLDELQMHPTIEVRTAYAHFANIEDTTDLNHAHSQVEAFDRAFTQVRARYPSVGRHLSATSGLMTIEQESGSNDLVRLGIGLYGLYPSELLAQKYGSLNLKPVMRWVSHLAQVKDLPAGHPVGYGLTYFATRKTKIGIVPQGYSDGYDRGLSNLGKVLVGGRRCPVIGRVAMNMFAVDLTSAPDASQGDEVVLLGAQGEERITSEEIADKLGTINYEIPSRISNLLPRRLLP
jgi:alanine racemase/glutamate racemase